MKAIIFLFVIFSINLSAQGLSFLDTQKGYERVGKAFDEKDTKIRRQLSDLGLNPGDLNIVILAYKEESTLEIFGKNRNEEKYKKIIAYPICAKSGEPGPKRREGDLQVPEGFYEIIDFNPLSSYHLSLGINYPNKSDKIKSDPKKPGGDIYIHGDCVTVGCLPMTDDIIKEIYVYAVNARYNTQQSIPVYIFPFRMTEANMKIYSERNSQNTGLIGFWENLKQGYDQFDSTKIPFPVRIDSKGNYLF